MAGGLGAECVLDGIDAEDGPAAVEAVVVEARPEAEGAPGAALPSTTVSAHPIMVWTSGSETKINIPYDGGKTSGTVCVAITLKDSPAVIGQVIASQIFLAKRVPRDLGSVVGPVKNAMKSVEKPLVIVFPKFPVMSNLADCPAITGSGVTDTVSEGYLLEH